MSREIVVVGGGPAGVMAAGIAALRGASVTLVEQGESVEAALLTAFSGEDALSNTERRLQFQHHFFGVVDQLEQAYKLFSGTKFLTFLDGLGLPWQRGDGEVILFGAGGAARAAAELAAWLERTGAKVRTGESVRTIRSDAAQLSGCTLTSGEEIDAAQVILAAGAGSEAVLASTAHNALPFAQSLHPIALSEAAPQSADLRKVRFYLWDGQSKLADFSGTARLEGRKLTGEPIENLSRALSRAMADGVAETLALTVDLFPAIDDGDMKQELNIRLADEPKAKLVEVLTAYVTEDLAEYIVTSLCTLPIGSKCTSLTKAVRKKLLGALKRFPLPLSTVSKIQGVTVSGGVPLAEINPENLESFVLSGLYIAGSAIDADARLGGFNLQHAFATGHLAGSAATGSVL